jgi:hypothetical protein
MDLELQKLHTKLEKIETELSKCRGSVLGRWMANTALCKKNEKMGLLCTRKK